MRTDCCTMRTECCTTSHILTVIVQNGDHWLLGKRELKRWLVDKEELNSRITDEDRLLHKKSAQEENALCVFYVRRNLKTRLKESFYRGTQNVTKSSKIHKLVLRAWETESPLRV